MIEFEGEGPDAALLARPEIVWMGEEFRIEVTDSDKVLQFTFIAVGVDAPQTR